MGQIINVDRKCDKNCLLMGLGEQGKTHFLYTCVLKGCNNYSFHLHYYNQT